jgi:hypothetical protein
MCAVCSCGGGADADADDCVFPVPWLPPNRFTRRRRIWITFPGMYSYWLHDNPANTKKE